MDANRNPFYSYHLSFTDGAVSVGLEPKYAGAERDHPIVIRGKYRFDSTPDGEAARAALEHHIKTGATVEIDSRFLEGFAPPNELVSVFPDLAEVRIDKLILGSSSIGKPIPVKLEIQDAAHRTLAEIPYVPLMVVQTGTEEITATGAVEARNLEVTLRLRSNNRGSSCSVRQTMTGASLLHIREFCHLRKAECFNDFETTPVGI